MMTIVIIMMTIVRIVINIVLYQDDYCMYLDDYCIVSWWLHSTGKCSEVKSYMQKFCSLWKNYILCDLQRNGMCFSVLWFFCAGCNCNCFRREIVLPDKRYWCIQHNTWVYDPHQWCIIVCIHVCVCVCLCVSVYSVQESTASPLGPTLP